MMRVPKELKPLPEDIKPSDDLRVLGETLSENYLWYHLVRAQLHDLQDWVRSQQVLSASPEGLP